MFAGSDYFRQLAVINDDSTEISVDEPEESTSNGREQSRNTKPKLLRKRMEYTQDQLQLAYEAVQNGISTYRACKIKTQELSMVASLHALADAGFTITYRLPRIFATEYVKANIAQFPKGSPFPAGMPSNGWSKHFLKRHPDLAKRMSEIWSHFGSTAVPESVSVWFGCVSKYLIKMGLQTVVQNRRQVFTMDDVELKRGKNDATFTCLFGSNANGNLLPPLILYPHTFKLPTQKKQSELKYAVAHQDTELTSGNVLYQWLSRVFQPWLIEENVPRPVILFLEGHRHQMGYFSSQFCHQHQIVPVSLLPRFVHVQRPLSVELIESIEQFWREEMQSFGTGRFTTMDPLLTPVLDRLTDIAESIIRDGFLRSKIYPWNPEGHMAEGTQPQPDENRSKLVLFRRMLESRLTDQELGEFKARRHDEEWRGPVEYASLFQVWRELMYEIDSVETGACSDMDTTQEGDVSSGEPDLVAVKEEETGECLLDFVKEEPSVDFGD